MHLISSDDFIGVVCDESSILKSFNGARRKSITEFMRKMDYRLLCTATAVPNDYTELGTSSEALGELGHVDMLNQFFKNDQNNISMKRHHGKSMSWRFKGHAEIPFWRWVSSWARTLRSPSDLGYDDDNFSLPPLIENTHIVQTINKPEGMLFSMRAVGLFEQRRERRLSLKERCDKVSELVSDTGQPALIWCHLNDEGDYLEKIITDGVQVSGRDSDESKVKKLLGFAEGEIRVLITKPKIGAWGLNFQHCAHVVYFPSYSYEQYYQGIRRCWRFGQTKSVIVDIISSEGELGILSSLKRKSKDADKMFTSLVSEMNKATQIKSVPQFTKKEDIPSWL